MKKLLIIPIIVFLATTSVILFNFLANSSTIEKQIETKKLDKEEQAYKGNADLKILDDDSVILKPISTTDQVQKSKQILLIRKNALDSGTVFINDGCTLSPLVTHVNAGDTLAFYNELLVDQTLNVNNRTYIVPAQKRILLQNLPTQETQLPITCGYPEILRGYLYITPSTATEATETP